MAAERMDKRDLRRKLLLRPLDWITLTPLLAGVTLGLGAWAVKADPGVAVASSIILMLLSAGLYLHRLLFGWNAEYEKLVAEWRDRVDGKRDLDLDDLYRKLSDDGDPRTETLLKDLRTLTKALMSEQGDSLALGAFDIVSSVDELFQRSVDYLRESLDLWQTAQEMGRESIRRQLMEQRETLIVEVERSLENLGDVLGTMKRAAVASGGHAPLDELREELNSRLKIAEEVENRMKAMRQGRVDQHDEATYMQYAKET